MRVKTVPALLLFALAFACLGAVPAFADEVVPVQDASAVFADANAPNDNDALFEAYLDEEYDEASMPLLSRFVMKTMSYDASARAQLDEYNQVIYDALAPQLKAVASGETTSAVFEVDGALLREAGLKDVYTAEDLGLDYVYKSGSSNPGFGEAIVKVLFGDSENPKFAYVNEALLQDMPADLYWYDKTAGLAYGHTGLYFVGNDTNGYVCHTDQLKLTFKYTVAQDYRDTTVAEDAQRYTVKSAASSIATAMANAASVVSMNADKGDYDKLDAYRAAICDAVSYDVDAAKNLKAYGDPWQLVYVFDGDANTNVVCEGYAKAFKYLCDKSTFANPSLACYTVPGGVVQNYEQSQTAEAHMWNIVRFNGKSYLVDVTNCDEATLGSELQANGTTPAGRGLFMKGYSGDSTNTPLKESDYYTIDLPAQQAGTFSRNPQRVYYLYTDLTALAVLPDGAERLSNADATEVVACTHEPLEAVIENEVAATCEEDGSYDEVVYCGICGEEISREAKTVDALGHEWDEGEVVDEATCETEGHVKYTCTRDASHHKVETTDALGHEWDEGVITTPATCTEDGVKTFTCKHDATHTKTEAVEKLGHEWGEWVVTTPATCEAMGVETRTCAHDAAHTETRDIDALGHDYTGGYETVKAATCTEKGLEQTVCKNDPTHVITRETAALGHNLTYVAEMPATCEEAGVAAHWKCETCKKLFALVMDAQVETTEEALAIEPIGHDWDAGVITTQPGCETTGVKTYTCKHDTTHTKTEEVAAVGHEWNDGVVTEQPGCETAGSKLYTCTRDGSHTYVETIPAAGHTWSAWTTTKAATCTEAGSKTRTCTKDANHVQTEIIPATGHDWDSKVTKIATCTEPGVKTLTCKNDPTHKMTEEVPAMGHLWDEGVMEDDPVSCTHDGTIKYTCKHDSTHTKTESVPATGHEWGEGVVTTEPGCETEGVMTYTCKNDSTHTKTEAIPAIGHGWNSGVVTKAATCVEDGVMTYTCKHDTTHTHDEAIAKSGHDWGEWAQMTPPTCTEAGSERRICNNDANHVETREVAALGHELVHHEAVASTCLATGTIEYWECTVCNKLYKDADALVETDDVTAPLADHDWDEWVVVINPTVDKEGKEARACKLDNSHVEERAIPKLNHEHKLVAHEAVDVDCTTAGSIAYWECTDCKLLYKDAEATEPVTAAETVIAPLGHDMKAVAEVSATCEETGVAAHYECERCEKLFADSLGENEVASLEAFTLNALGHKWDEGAITTEPGCETAGVKTYTCENDATHTKTEAVEVTGHLWGEWVRTTEPGCETTGVDTRTCVHDAAHTDTREVAAIGHDWVKDAVIVPATCDEQGETRYVCTHDGTHDKVEVTDALGHAWSEGVVTTAPTCTADGVKTYTCINDNSHTYTEAVPALGHEWGEWVVTKAATATTAGERQRTCKHDATHVETEAIPATGGSTGGGGYQPPAPSKTRVTVPSAVTGLVFTNAELIGVAEGEGYIVTGNKALHAGTYEAVATLTDKENSTWADGTVADKKITWSIAKGQLAAVYVGETIEEGATPALTVVVGGFAAGDDADNTGGYTAPVVKAPETLKAGESYVLTPADGDADDYEFTYASGTLKVVEKTEPVKPSEPTKPSEPAKPTVPANVSVTGKTVAASAYANSAVKTVKMGSKTTTVGSKAFMNAKKLTSVTLGKNVKTIGSYAFKNCTALTKVTVPTKTTSIGKGAFAGCTKLKSAVIGKNVKKVGASAFSGDKKLKTLTIKTTKLTKASCKNMLKGSSVKTIKLTGMSKAEKKKAIAKYSKWFPKKVAGKKLVFK